MILAEVITECHGIVGEGGVDEGTLKVVGSACVEDKRLPEDSFFVGTDVGSVHWSYLIEIIFKF